MKPSPPQYMKSQTFFDGNRWSAHDRVGELLAQGVSQITIAREGDEITVSWPSRSVPPVLPDEGVAA